MVIRFLVAIALAGLLSVGAAFANLENGAPTVHTVAEGGRPAIATDEQGGLHIALEAHDKDLDLVGIFYSKSTDAAATWAPPIEISDPGKSAIADLAVEKSGAVDVAWSYTTSVQDSTDIFVVHSPNGGKTWATPMDISNTPGVSSQPDVAVGPDNSINVVWKDTATSQMHPEIYYSFSRDRGSTWSNAEKVSDASGDCSEPAIAVGQDGTVHIAWENKITGKSSIYYARRISGKWSKAIDLSKSSRVCTHPDIACGPGGKISVCWAENSKPENFSNICLSIGNKQGQFDKPRNISKTPGASNDPALVADYAGRVAVVWSDTTSGDATPDILGLISFDSGATFSNIIDFSNKEGVSIHPDVALSANELFVVWEDVLPKSSVVKATCTKIKDAYKPTPSTPARE